MISDRVLGSLLHPSMQLRVKENNEYIYPPLNLLKKRIFFSDKDPLLEPVFISLNADDRFLYEWSSRLALSKFREDLYLHLKSKIKN